MTTSPVNDRSLYHRLQARELPPSTDNGEIDIGRKPPIEPELGTARSLPTFESREVEIRKSSRVS